jgi:hypothetical protein
MRTTVEITDEQRAKLLQEAAGRGEKGFSSIIQEAIDRYFESQSESAERLERARRAVGALAPEEAERLGKDMKSLRRTWR